MEVMYDAACHLRTLARRDPGRPGLRRARALLVRGPVRGRRDLHPRPPQAQGARADPHPHHRARAEPGDHDGHPCRRRLRLRARRPRLRRRPHRKLEGRPSPPRRSGSDVEVHALGPAMRHLMASLRSSNYYEINLVHPRIGNAWSLPVYACGYSDELDAVEAGMAAWSVPDGPRPRGGPTTGTT